MKKILSICLAGVWLWSGVQAAAPIQCPPPMQPTFKWEFRDVRECRNEIETYQYEGQQCIYHGWVATSDLDAPPYEYVNALRETTSDSCPSTLSYRQTHSYTIHNADGTITHGSAFYTGEIGLTQTTPISEERERTIEICETVNKPVKIWSCWDLR